MPAKKMSGGEPGVPEGLVLEPEPVAPAQPAPEPAPDAPPESNTDLGEREKAQVESENANAEQVNEQLEKVPPAQPVEPDASFTQQRQATAEGGVADPDSPDMPARPVGEVAGQPAGAVYPDRAV